MKRIVLITWAGVTIVLAGLLAAILSPRPDLESESSLAPIEYTDKEGDQELAYLLVNWFSERGRPCWGITPAPNLRCPPLI